jgi:hypothetical protein
LTAWDVSHVSIEQLPSGKYRAAVRHGGAKQTSEAVLTKGEARMPEAELKLEMGSQPSIREQHSVGEVVSGYLADGTARLSPATLDFYRKGHDAMPDAFRQRPVTTVTPLVLDSLYAELRQGGASEHKCQKCIARAVEYVVTQPIDRNIEELIIRPLKSMF